MLKKIQNIVLEVTPPMVEVQSDAPYHLENPEKGNGTIVLVCDDTQLQPLRDEVRPNLLHGLQRLNDSVVESLKQYGNRVILAAPHLQVDFDLCDSFTAQRFLVEILDEGVTQPYSDYMIWYYFCKENPGGGTMAANIDNICGHVSWYHSGIERHVIAKKIASRSKVTVTTITKEINTFITTRENDTNQKLADGEAALPGWINTERYYRVGFDSKVDEMRSGIYFATGNGPKRLTNFVFTPLIHVYTKDESENRRLTEIDNGFTKAVLELPSKAFTSMEYFESVVSSEGAFFTYDGFSKSHLNKMKSTFLPEYPKCFELKTLGWQPEGFFSFANLIYQNEPIEYNNYGYAQVGDYNYLSMGASNILAGVRGEDDIYKNDKYLKYIPTTLTFNKWSALMLEVYPDHGMMAVTYVIMSLFKDILFKRNNNFPMLYPYGQVSSGKSKYAESICNLFTHNMPMFNLANGTDYAFFQRLSRFRNVAVAFNEFDEATINENWFRAFKGAYDGEGRDKGTGIKNKTKTQDINCAPILIGQYLSTKDDNAVVSRTLPCKITLVTNRSAKQVARYTELKELEKQGLSGMLTELLNQRDHMAENYNATFAEIARELKAALEKDGIIPQLRVHENYSVALATMRVISQVIPIGFSYKQFSDYCIRQVTDLTAAMAESNVLSEFWKVVELMLDQHTVEQGYHYKIEVKTDVRLNGEKKTTHVKQFAEPKKLLYLRLSTMHNLYSIEYRRIKGKTGQNEATILSYMKEQPYYIGSSPASSFTDSKGNSTNTSSYVFDYDMMGINLERYREAGELQTVTLTGTIYHDAIIEDVLGIGKLKFTLLQDESYTDAQGNKVRKDIYTRCLCDNLTYNISAKHGRTVAITGNLNISQSRGTEYRNMHVTEIDFMPAPVEQEEIF